VREGGSISSKKFEGKKRGKKATAMPLSRGIEMEGSKKQLKKKIRVKKATMEGGTEKHRKRKKKKEVMRALVGGKGVHGFTKKM